MIRLDAVPIRAGETVTFEPGGDHVMLVDIEKPLIPGETITATLIFERAGEMEVVFPILDARTERR